MTIARWNRSQAADCPTFSRWPSLRDELDRLFEPPFFGFARPLNLLDGWAPSVDLFENADELLVRVELPGMTKEAIEVALHDGTLTVSGERREPVKEGVETHRHERFAGRFQRSIAIPAPVEAGKVKASYQDGVLQIVLPKSEAAKPKHIDVKVK